MNKQYYSGLGIKAGPEKVVEKVEDGRIWVTLDNPTLGLRIIDGNKTTANIQAGRYQAKWVEHPISPGRNTLEVFDEENPAYVVVETLPGQGVNLIIEDIVEDSEDIGIAV